MTKVYISNIRNITIKEIYGLTYNEEPFYLRTLLCDRQIEGCSTERNATSVLHPAEYDEVMNLGYYIIDDKKA